MFEGIVRDVTYAVRTLQRSPAFTIVAVVSLALGIGANTAIFSLIDQVLLRTLPVPNPQQLVILQSPGPKTGHVSSDENGDASSWSYPIYKDLRDKSTVFSGLIARFGFNANVTYRGQTDRANGEMVSGNYFDVIGVTPAIGRGFTPMDDSGPADASVAVLGHSFWTRHFGARRDVLNQEVTLNGHSMTIVGVAPAGFFGDQLGLQVDVFVPITMKSRMTPNWDGLNLFNDYWLNIIGRLKPNVTPEQAQAQLQPIYRPLLETAADEATMKGDRRKRFVEKPILLQSGANGRPLFANSVRQPLLVLMGMVGLVLLIACANVANLMVAKATTREREISVRLAIGASRSRLIRQCLVESVVLAAAGGLLGLIVANWTVSGLLQLMPAATGANALSSELDARVLLFGLALTLGTGILFGLLPALETTRPDINSGLKAGTASSSAARHARIRKVLVVAQVSFTLLMIVGAGLFTKTILKLQSVDIGIKADRVVRFSLAPDLSGYNSQQSRDFYQRLQASLETQPGVSSATLAQIPVFADSDAGSNGTIEGYTPGPDEDIHLSRNWIGSAYFSTLGIPVIAGREFTSADSADSPKVCIINQAMADRYFAGRNPIGYHVAFGAGNKVVPDMEIVGVVNNSKHSTMREQVQTFIYTPYVQQKNINAMVFYVRGGIAAEGMMTAIRGKVRELDPRLPVTEMKTLETQIEETLYQERFMSFLTAAFGALSVLLAGFGIYGVMSYLVSRRTREIGIRIAVGAQPSFVQWMVVREILVMVLIGVAAGLPLALLLGRTAQSMLFGMTGNDPQVIVLALFSVAILGLAAGYFPARRATRINPVIALRNE